MLTTKENFFDGLKILFLPRVTILWALFRGCAVGCVTAAVVVGACEATVEGVVEVEAPSRPCSCNILGTTGVTVRGGSRVVEIKPGGTGEDVGLFGKTETLVTGGHQDGKAGLTLAGG